MLDHRNEFISKMTEKLVDTNDRILGLEVRARRLDGAARDRLEESIAAARKLRSAVYQRVQELRLDGPEVWQVIKPEIEEDWESVSDAVEKAQGRLQ
jgi:hypothetical protein